jgi:hypothetical protein
VVDAEALFSADPGRRLDVARRLQGRARRRMETTPEGWPALSPGARNAWLLLVTTKPPSWRDPLIPWPDASLTLGEPHPGFLYPDPIGFWAEVRRWAIAVLRRHDPTWSTAEALALTALIHLGDAPERLAVATSVCRPRMIVLLDEAAASTASIDVAAEAVSIPDPHRPDQSYVGWWGTTTDGRVVGKAPQHPTMHRLYRAEDLDRWLARAPWPRAVDL